MLTRIFRRTPKKRFALHINEFRTDDYRVFYAAPYFNVDLEHEVKWHKSHLKTLHKHAKKPHLFHKQYHDGEITPERERHFKEHVLDSIPFHSKIKAEHEKRFATIRKIMPKRVYKKLVHISREHGGTPEYFVYDKKDKDFFFVCDGFDLSKKKWIDLVKHKYKLCEVLVL